MNALSNVDPSELAKFSELAHRWWDLEGEFKPLHQINPLRLNWIDQCASLRGKKVVDVGCGGGILADSMARRGAQVTGIDLASKSLKVARLHALESQTPSISYRETSAEDMARDHPAEFDVVTCMEMLEHVPQPLSIVRSCAALAKPGGWVFFSTLHRNAQAFFKGIVAAEYLLNLVPRGTHEYARMIKPSELARYCRDSGLEVVELKGMAYDPLAHRHQLNQDVSVNYLLAARKPQHAEWAAGQTHESTDQRQP